MNAVYDNVKISSIRPSILALTFARTGYPLATWVVAVLVQGSACEPALKRSVIAPMPAKDRIFGATRHVMKEEEEEEAGVAEAAVVAPRRQLPRCRIHRL